MFGPEDEEDFDDEFEDDEFEDDEEELDEDDEFANSDLYEEEIGEKAGIVDKEGNFL